MTDRQLMFEAAKGDGASFESLYHRHWRAVYRYAWVLTRSVPDAEDITQDCFIALIRGASLFDSARAQVRTWLLAVTRNQYLRRSKNRANAEVHEETERLDPGTPIDEELISGERADAVQRAVQALPLLQRETIYLFEFEGLSLAETAAILEIEPNAVKARLHRAREQLKRSLTPLRPALSRGAMEPWSPTMNDKNSEMQDPELERVRTEWDAPSPTAGFRARVANAYTRELVGARKPWPKPPWRIVATAAIVIAAGIVLLIGRETRTDSRYGYRPVEQPRFIVITQGENP